MTTNPPACTRTVSVPALLLALSCLAVAQKPPSLGEPEGVLLEVPSLRSEFAKHYALPGGGFRMVLTPEGAPQHWWDGSLWRDFDLRFRPVQGGETMGGFQFTCQENGLRTWVLADSPMGEWVRVQVDGLAMQWVPMLIGPSLDLVVWGPTNGNAPVGDSLELPYRGACGLKSVYTLRRNSLKHDVVLPAAPKGGLLGGPEFLLSWAVMIEGARTITGNGGADLRAGGDASAILVSGPAGARGLFVPPVTIEDGGGRTFSEHETGARYRLRPQGNDLYVLETVVPMAWVLAGERVWPLRIDPTVYPVPNNNCATGIGNAVGTVDSTNYAWSSLLSLDVNHDNQALNGCTVVNNARTFAWAKYSPAYSAPQEALPPNAMWTRCSIRFSFVNQGGGQVANNSPWDVVVVPGGLCGLTWGTFPGNGNVFNNIAGASSIVSGSSMNNFVNPTIYSGTITNAAYGAGFFSGSSLHLAWRANPAWGANGCALLYAPSLYLAIDYELPPAAPGSSNLSSSSATLSWNSVNGASSYAWQLASNSSFSPVLLSGTTSSLPPSVTLGSPPLQPATRYYFRARATNSLGVSGGWSSYHSFWTLPATPTPGSASSITTSSFVANWTGHSNSSSYEVMLLNQAGNPVSGISTQTVSHPSTSCAWSQLSPNTTYRFKVRAHHTQSGGASPYSSPSSLVTTSPLPNPPGMPTGLSVSNVTSTSCTVTWNLVTGASHYTVSWAPNGTPFTVTVPPTVLSGLLPATQYTVSVKAENLGGSSFWVTTTFTTLNLLAAPTTLPADEVTTNSFRARWNAVPGATGYWLDVSTTSGFMPFVEPYANYWVGSATSHTVSGLGANQTYYYQVRAGGNAGVSPDSDTRSVSTLPNAPQASAATDIGLTSFVARWNAVPSPAGYRLDVAFDLAFTSFVNDYQDFDVGTATSHQVTGLPVGSTCYYRLRAHNGTGPSGNSNTITVTLLQYPVPTLESLSPEFAMAATPAITLVLIGSNFVEASRVHWNETELVTTWVSPTRLHALLDATLLAAVGQASVTVVTPSPGGGTSNTRTFTIADPATGLPATNLRILSTQPGSDVVLRWDAPPDYQSTIGYRVRRYATPDRSTPPVEYSLPNMSQQFQTSVLPAGTCYFDIVVVRGNGVLSIPTRLVKMGYTTNRWGGDVTGDGRVDGRDLMDVLVADGGMPGHSNTGGRWNPAADCNGDGRIDASDRTIVTTNMGNRQ